MDSSADLLRAYQECSSRNDINRPIATSDIPPANAPPSLTSERTRTAHSVSTPTGTHSARNKRGRGECAVGVTKKSTLSLAIRQPARPQEARDIVMEGGAPHFIDMRPRDGSRRVPVVDSGVRTPRPYSIVKNSHRVSELGERGARREPSTRKGVEAAIASEGNSRPTHQSGVRVGTGSVCPSDSASRIAAHWTKDDHHIAKSNDRSMTIRRRPGESARLAVLPAGHNVLVANKGTTVELVDKNGDPLGHTTCNTREDRVRAGAPYYTPAEMAMAFFGKKAEPRAVVTVERLSNGRKALVRRDVG